MTQGAADNATEGGEAPPALRCLNCGAELTGRFCAACGQRDDRHVHSLGHFLGEAFEGLTHADSRLWRTLWPLLARPGFLTREFFGGRRQRYLPPFRLYIVVSLLFFLVLALRPDVVRLDVSALEPDDPVSLDARVAKVTTLEATPGLDPARKAALGMARQALEAQRERQAHDSRDAASAEPERRAAMTCDNLGYEGPGQAWLQPRLEAGCRKSVTDPGSLGRAFVHNIPRALFFFLPLIAAFMLLLYWRPRRYYVEHLLFLIHNHAMVFLLGIFVVPAAMIVPSGLATALLAALVTVWVAWYLFRAMRVYYGQGRVRTFVKFLAMGGMYVVVSAVMLVFTILFSVATL